MIKLGNLRSFVDCFKVITCCIAMFCSTNVNAGEDISYHVKLSTAVPETHTRFEPEASHLLYVMMNEIEYLIKFPDDPVNSAKVIKLIVDLDIDGVPEAVVATWPGGNCCGPRYYVVSPREEGFFSVQTHEDMKGFSNVELVYADGKPIIKLLEKSPSENLTVNNEILSYYSYASGRIEQLEKNINSAIVPSLAEITAKEMVDKDRYTILFKFFLFDVDDDGEDESLICRRHPTTNQVHCDGFTSRIHGDIKLTQGCSRIGFIASKTDGLHDIVCGRNDILRFNRASMAYH